jgi:hypothetical protein
MRIHSVNDGPRQAAELRSPMTDDSVTATVRVSNTGARSGIDVRGCTRAAAGHRGVLLVGFERVDLDPGESGEITPTVDTRLPSKPAPPPSTNSTASLPPRPRRCAPT